MGTTSLTPCIRSCPTRFRRSSGHAPILPPHTEIFNHETLVTQPPLHPIAPFIRALSYSPITISPTETRKFLKHLARHHCWSLHLHSSRSVLRGRCARALPCKTKRTASGTRCVFHAAPARGAKIRLRRWFRRRVLRRKSAPLPPRFRVCFSLPRQRRDGGRLLPVLEADAQRRGRPGLDG